MRIIRQGTIPEHRQIETTCNNCDTVFEFQPIEAKYNNDQRDGDFYSIACPTCKHTCNVTKYEYRGPG